MHCQNCNHSYDLSTHLPILNQNGTTECQKCFKQKLNMQDNENCSSQFKIYKQLKVNKELIKIMGRCPTHIQQKLTIFDVQSKKRRCAKCVIFDKNKQKYQGCTFIEIDEIGKLNDTVSNNVKQLVSKMNKIEKQTVLKVKQNLLQAQKKTLQILHVQYQRNLSQLNKKYQNQIKNIKNNISQILNRYKLQQFMTQFIKKKDSIEKINIQKLNVEQKYYKISETYKNDKEIQKLLKLHQRDIKNIKSDLQNYSKNYSFNFNFNVSQNIFTSKQINIDSKTEKAMQYKNQQSLLDDLDQDFKMQVSSYTDFNLDLTYSIKNINSQISTERTSLTCTSILNSQNIANPENKSKSTLNINNIGDLNKIGTDIRQIIASGIDLNNTDAKKVLALVSKSFTKTLDLSHNKIPSLFIKQLNKSLIGKYLKTIKLNNNQIDSKDPSISKKIQQLKSQGVLITI